MGAVGLVSALDSASAFAQTRPASEASPQGESKLIGADNGRIGSQDSKGSRVTAFNGLCLAIVQSTARAGEIRVTATSPGRKSTAVTIATKG